MAMHTLCAGFVWATIKARLSLLDKNIGTSARSDAYITEKLHTKNVIFLTGSAYALYAHLTTDGSLYVRGPKGRSSRPEGSIAGLGFLET